jgi:DNA invertase Pin-like site-specific DNA recombinase
MKAAWYGRVSSAGQVEHGSSLETQRDKCEAAITARGWTLAGAYVDEGISGAKEDRPRWQALLTACRNGSVQAVVVSSLDRMARNAAHAIRITDELERLGVIVVILRENIDLATPAGRMMRTVLAGVAEMERDLIRERSITGQRAKAARDAWPGGQPSFGWRLEGKGKEAHAVPDLAERETLTQMVKWTLDGWTTGQISRELTRRNIPTRTGAPWSITVVRRMLRNETLTTGEHRWGHLGKYRDRHYKTAVDPRTGKPAHGEPIIVQLPEPPLDRATFDAVQAMLDAAPRAGAKQDNQQRQLLTGRVFGECGRHHLGTIVVSRKGEQKAIYRPQCRQRPKPGQLPCKCGQIDVAKLDPVVWGEIVAVLGDRTRLLKLAEAWTQRGTTTPADTGEATKLEERAHKLTRAIERTKDASFMEDDPTELLERVARYRAELASVRHRLDSLQSVAPEAREKSGRLREMAFLADRAAQRLAGLSPEQRGELVALLELRVEVSGPVVNGEPREVQIRGVLDPRIA